jgi:hypothetical protein
MTSMSTTSAVGLVKLTSNILTFFLEYINDTKSQMLPFLLSGGPDECQVAADIYQCGRDIAPAATADIFSISKGNATVVRFIFRCFHLCHAGDAYKK